MLRCGEFPADHLVALAGRYGARIDWVSEGGAIPGSFWGDSEAGLVGEVVWLRPDTPVHSFLHELCHYICMDGQRRASLDRDAGGDFAEEYGVCFLQILLSCDLPGVGSARLMTDMDAWGYSFRLGSAKRWFEEDADDARAWLLSHGLVQTTGTDVRPTYRCRA